MASTFLGIEIGKRGILSHQTGMTTISNNLANSANESYSRQQVKMESMPSLYDPSLNRESTAGQIGQGASATSITRVRDEFVDNRIVEESSLLGNYDIRYKFMKQIEQIFNEPGQPTLKQKFDDFVGSWNDLALNPENNAAREALVTSSQNMLGFVKEHYQNLTKLRSHVDGMVRDKVNEINLMAGEIRDLNVQIVKIQAMGDNPNSLLDKRDAVLEKLSKIADIKVVKTDPDEILVYLNSRPLVQGTKVSKLETVNSPDNDGLASVIWESGEKVQVKSGELNALLEVRDKDILMAMKKLDNFVINLSESINSIHKEGFGLNPVTGLNFFSYQSITKDSNGNYDSNQDGQIDQTRIFKITGTQKLTGDEKIGESGFLNLGSDDSGKDVIVAYKETESVKEVMTKINQSKARVNAYLDQEGRMSLKALYSESKDFPDFAIRHLEDTGVFLTSFTGVLKGSGRNGAFDYKKIDQSNQFASADFTVSYDNKSAMWMNVDDAILNNPANIAARLGKDTDGDGKLDIPNGVSEGKNAFRIISALVSENEKNGLDKNTGMDSMPVMLDKNQKSFRPFLDSLVASIGETAKADKMNLDKENSIMTGLKNLRESVSGVNIDEELVNLIKYQHGYQAAAKIVNTMNEMLDVIMKLGR